MDSFAKSRAACGNTITCTAIPISSIYSMGPKYIRSRVGNNLDPNKLLDKYFWGQAMYCFGTSPLAYTLNSKSQVIQVLQHSVKVFGMQV